MDSDAIRARIRNSLQWLSGNVEYDFSLLQDQDGSDYVDVTDGVTGFPTRISLMGVGRVCGVKYSSNRRIGFVDVLIEIVTGDMKKVVEVPPEAIIRSTWSV
jgi:hypothetical protein